MVLDKFAAAAIAAVILVQAGQAQADDGDRPSPRQFHEQMCKERYAHLIGRLAYLQAKLELTAEQQPLWDRWQQAATDGAGKMRAVCLERAESLDHDRTIVDRLKLMQKRLATGAAALDAAQPALAALYDKLTPAQRELVEEALHHGHHGWRHHHHHGDGGESQRQ